MDLSKDYIVFSLILDQNGFTEIKGSTKSTTYFRNVRGDMLTVNRIKDYDENYLAELADQASYNMDELIRVFKLIKKVQGSK